MIVFICKLHFILKVASKATLTMVGGAASATTTVLPEAVMIGASGPMAPLVRGVIECNSLDGHQR